MTQNLTLHNKNHFQITIGLVNEMAFCNGHPILHRQDKNSVSGLGYRHPISIFKFLTMSDGGTIGGRNGKCQLQKRFLLYMVQFTPEGGMGLRRGDTESARRH